MDALLAAGLAFVLSFIVLSLVLLVVHKLTKNADRSYLWGVLIFALLAALYAYSTSVGRR